MTLREILRAAGLGAVLLILLGAAAFGAVYASVATADHARIAAAIAATPGADRGLPELDPRIRDFREGYFPDCAGLAILLREQDWREPVDAAVRADVILPRPDRTLCQELATALEDREAVTWFTYARYWHGSLLLHRAVLGAADYATLKIVATVLAWTGWLGLLAALGSRLGWPAAVAVMGPVALLTDIVAVGALPVLAVGVAALFTCAAAFVMLGARRSGATALVVAGLAGAVYNFWDFFCNPAVLAALCAWSWLMAGRQRGDNRGLFGGLCIFAAVLSGYLGMWAMKWAVAVIYDLSGGDVYILNAGELTRWSAPQVESWLPGRATLAILARMMDAPWKAAVAAGILLPAVAVGWRRLREPGFWLMLAPVLAAVLVLEVMAGHTIAHTAITFRLMPVALGLIVAGLVTDAARAAGRPLSPMPAGAAGAQGRSAATPERP